MNNFKRLIAPLALLAAMSLTLAAHAQSRPEAPPSSAKSSPPSAIPAGKGDALTSACNAAADDLLATRQLVDSLESENALLKSRLEAEKQTTALLLELNETRRSETEALRLTVSAKNETIAAKDAVIASQDKLIETLNRKKSSPWKRVLDVLIGVGVGVVLR